MCAHNCTHTRAHHCCAPCTHTHTIAVCLAHTCAHNCCVLAHTHAHTRAHHCCAPCTHVHTIVMYLARTHAHTHTHLCCVPCSHTHTHPFAVYLAHTRVHSCWCALHIHTHTMSSLPPLPRALGSPRAPDLVGSKARFSPPGVEFPPAAASPAGEASLNDQEGWAPCLPLRVSVHQSS